MTLGHANLDSRTGWLDSIARLPPVVDDSPALVPFHQFYGTSQNKLSADCFRFEPGDYFSEIARLLEFIRHNRWNTTSHPTYSTDLPSLRCFAAQ